MSRFVVARRGGAAAIAAAALWTAPVPDAPRAYPLDAGPETGIERLEGYRLAQEGIVRGPQLPAGARLPSAAVKLRLLDHADLELPAPDAELGRRLATLLGEEAPRYGLALLDLSDPEAPRYAEHRADVRFNPGSVGKLLVALAVLQSLADLYPDDPGARRRTLRESPVTADAFSRGDHHEVPFWTPGAGRVSFRTLREGDTANLWTYLDWMVSASSNAAASMVIQQILLLRHFGLEYPVAPERAAGFLADTPRADSSALLVESLRAPVISNGLSPDDLRQGGFFSAEGKRRIPGTSSTSTARELMRYLLRMEQGRLVDPSSSLELKRLLYMTQRRIRYASSPALTQSAVFFKSGSLYRCQPEPDFQCLKYQGNVENVMNSVAIIESPAGEPRLHYLVVVTSNVLRKNSAVEHQTLATRIHRLIEAAHPEPPPPTLPEPS